MLPGVRAEGVLECEERPGEIKLVHAPQAGILEVPQGRGGGAREDGVEHQASVSETRLRERLGRLLKIRATGGGRRVQTRARLVPCNDPKRLRDRLRDDARRSRDAGGE